MVKSLIRANSSRQDIGIVFENFVSENYFSKVQRHETYLLAIKHIIKLAEK